jgi:hypothetical protein
MVAISSRTASADAASMPPRCRLDAEMKRAAVARVLEQHQLQRRRGDGEVGVAGSDLSGSRMARTLDSGWHSVVTIQGLMTFPWVP